MDLTGSRKYSGRSAEQRCVSAGGEQAARRAMPTNWGLGRIPEGEESAGAGNKLGSRIESVEAITALFRFLFAMSIWIF